MQIFDTPTEADSNPDLLAQADALARRKALLAEQARRAAQSIGVEVPSPGESTGWNSAVTGTRIGGQTLKTPTAALLSPILQQIGNGPGGLNEMRLQSDEKQFNRDVSRDALSRLQQMPQGTPATPTTYGAGDEGPTMKPGTPAVEPSLRDRLMWASGLTDNPRTAGVAQKYIEDQLINAPDRATKAAWERIKFAAELNDKSATRTETERHNRAAEGKESFAVSQDGSVIVNTRSGEAKRPMFTDVSGNQRPVLSKEQQKEVEASAKSVSDSSNAVDNLIPRAKDALTTATAGWWQQAKNAWARGMDNPSNPSMLSDAALGQLSGQLTSTVPRFEGPQSDSDRIYYAQQAGDVGNVNKSRPERLASLAEVERMHRTKIGVEGAKIERLQSGEPIAPVPGSSMLKQPAPNKSPAVDTSELEAQYRATRDPNERAMIAQRLSSAGVPVLDNRTQYDRLPSGTRYLDSKGNAGVKR